MSMASGDGSFHVAKRNSGWAFALVAATQLLLILAIAIVIVPITIYGSVVGYSRSDIALVASGYGLVFAGLLLFGSRLGDKYGRRRALQAGLVIFAIGSIVGTAAPGYSFMVVARLIQGAGAALAAPSAMALVGHIYPDEIRRGRALAIYGVMGSIGGICGVLVSGAIATGLSWRWSFAIPGLIALTLAIASTRILSSDSSTDQVRMDVPGAVLATTGLLGVGYGLMQAGERGFASPHSYVPLSVGLVLLGLFTMVERRVREPLLPLGFLASKIRVASWVALLLITATNAVSTFMLTLYFEQVRQYSPAEIALAFLPFTLVVTTSFFSGRMITRMGPGYVASAGQFIAALGLAAISMLTAGGSGDVLMYAGMVALPFGVGLTFAGTTVTAFKDVPDRQAGLAGGVLNTAIEIGAAGGIAVTTAIVGAYVAASTASGSTSNVAVTGGYAFAFRLIALALVVSALVCAIILRNRPKVTTAY